MNDQLIINYFYTAKGTFLKRKLIDIPEEIAKYIENRYNDSLSIEETIKRIYYKIDLHPLCPICGKPVKFMGKPSKMWQTYCSRNCLSKANVQKIEDKYGIRCTLQLNNVKEKSKQTCLEKYGVEHNWQNKDIHQKCINTCADKYGENYRELFHQKSKQTCLKRYGVEHHMKLDEYKQQMVERNYLHLHDENKIKIAQAKAQKTFFKKYGAKSPMCSDSVKQKRYATLSKNNTWNTSTIEQELITYFNENNIEYVYQYSSDKYPYKCDFYFPTKDLYVEIQGNWTHGSHPYNNDNIEDAEKLNVWKERISKTYYVSAINTWTISDVNKRNIALKNNLNYLEIFSIDKNVCVEKILERLC